MRARSAVSWAGAICGIAAIALAWLTLWPIGLGGSTGYAMIVGTSMEPRLHRGDVALVRKASSYRVGEVVAYHSRTLGRIVLHRIIGVHDGRYVFKGDANTFTDPGDVQSSDLIGRYWFKVGGAAPVLTWVQRPWHAALIAGVLGLLLFGGGAGNAVRTRRRRRPARAPAAPRAPGVSAHVWQPLVLIGLTGLVAFATLGLIARSLPTTRQVPTDHLYGQTGRFSYGTRVPVSAAYPTGRVSSGEAVFTRLVQRLDVGFAWRFDSARPHIVHGTASLALDVSDGGGWTRRIELAPSTPFAGNTLNLTGTLRIDELETMLRRLETVTGTHTGSYSLGIVPTITLAGVVDGSRLSDAFAPALALSLDQLRLQFTASADPSRPNSLVRTKETGGVLVQPNTIRLVPGRRFALRPAEHTALVGAAASLAVILLGLLLRVRRRAPGGATLRAEHGHLIVRVADASAAARVVDLTDFDDLVRIAERYDRLILRDESAGVFVVEEEGVSYRWSAQPGAPPVERRHIERRPWSGPRLDPPADGGVASAWPER